MFAVCEDGIVQVFVAKDQGYFFGNELRLSVTDYDADVELVTGNVKVEMELEGLLCFCH